MAYRKMASCYKEDILKRRNIRNQSTVYQKSFFMLITVKCSHVYRGYDAAIAQEWGCNFKSLFTGIIPEEKSGVNH